MHCAPSTSKRRTLRWPAVGVASFGGKDCSVATAAGGPSRARRCSDGGVNAAADGIHRVDGPVLRCAHGAAKRNGAVGGRSQCTERNGVPASSRATAISCGSTSTRIRTRRLRDSREPQACGSIAASQLRIPTSQLLRLVSPGDGLADEKETAIRYGRSAVAECSAASGGPDRHPVLRGRPREAPDEACPVFAEAQVS